MEMKDTVCAVVVTYNRKNLLIECLEAIRKQTRPVQGIYLIDNASEDGTPELLLEKGYISELPPQNIKEPWEREFIIPNLIDGSSIKVHYVRMHENTGSSGGFHEGVKRAYEKGYDWLWLMDDDCLPERTCLKYQISSTDELTITGPVVINLSNKIDKIWNYDTFEGRKKIYHKIYDFLKIPYLTIPFNGFLISKKSIEIIGFPLKELFIYSDDEEYSFRAYKFGIKLKIVKDAVLFHPHTSGSKKFTYFKYRNNLFVRKKFDKYYLRTLVVILKILVKGNDVSFYIRIKAIWDALMNNITTKYMVLDNKLVNFE